MPRGDHLLLTWLGFQAAGPRWATFFNLSVNVFGTSFGAKNIEASKVFGATNREIRLLVADGLDEFNKRMGSSS